MAKIAIKRAYDPQSEEDGFRIYIDRLWPRGLSHENFHYDLWDKDISPSTDLREWFHQDPVDRWTQFEEKYKQELLANPAFQHLKSYIATKPIVTLLYSSNDREHNNAVVLQKLLSSPS